MCARRVDDEARREAGLGLILVETGEGPAPVSLHAGLMLPHRIHAMWSAHGVAWGTEAA